MKEDEAVTYKYIYIYICIYNYIYMYIQSKLKLKNKQEIDERRFVVPSSIFKLMRVLNCRHLLLSKNDEAQL